jgi:hypothetical protein
LLVICHIIGSHPGADLFLFLLLLSLIFFPPSTSVPISPIRLGDRGAFGGTSSGSGPLEILASVPYFLIGATGALFAWVEANWTRLPFVDQFRPRSGYRTVAVDDDAEILRGAYEDD